MEKAQNSPKFIPPDSEVIFVHCVTLLITSIVYAISENFVLVMLTVPCITFVIWIFTKHYIAEPDDNAPKSKTPL